MSMTWCCQVVSTETPIRPNHSPSSTRAMPRQRGARRSHNNTSMPMCSEGARLYGRSTPVSSANSGAVQSPVGGRSKAKRSGNAA